MTGWKGKEPYYALYLSCAAVLIALLVILAPTVADIAILLGAFSFVVAAVCVGITLRLGKGLPPAVGALLLAFAALALVAVFHFTSVDDALRAFLLAEPEAAQVASIPPDASRNRTPPPAGPAEPQAPTEPDAAEEPEEATASEETGEPTTPPETEDGLVWSDGAPPADAFGDPPETADTTGAPRDYDTGLRPTPTPQPRDPGLTGEVTALAQRAATLEDEPLWEAIRELRTRVAESPAAQDAAAAHERLDQIIVQRIAERATPLYAQAFERFQAQEIDDAERICRETIALAGAETIPALHSADRPGPLPVEQAQLLLDRIEQYRRMRDTPEERFRVRGIVKARGDTLANVEDRLTGIRHRVRRGDRVEEFRVERVDETDGSVQISLGSRYFTLSND